MRKAFLYILLLISLAGVGQTTGSYWRVTTKNTPFGRDLPDSVVIVERDSAKFYQIAHVGGVTATQTMAYAWSQGWVKNFPKGFGGYTAAEIDPYYIHDTANIAFLNQYNVFNNKLRVVDSLFTDYSASFAGDVYGNTFTMMQCDTMLSVHIGKLAHRTADGNLYICNNIGPGKQWFKIGDIHTQDSLNDRYRRKDTASVIMSKTRYSHDTVNIAYLNQQNPFTKSQIISSTDTLIPLSIYTNTYSTKPQLILGYGSYEGGRLHMSTGNLFVGYQSGRFITGNMNANVFLGPSAGEAFIGGALGGANLFVGYNAGSTTQYGNRNTYLGCYSGQGDRGDYNTYVGASSGYTWPHHANRRILIGYAAGNTYSDSASYKLYIESSSADSANAIIYGDMLKDWLRLNADVTVRNSLRIRGLTNVGTPDSTLYVENAQIVKGASPPNYWGRDGTTLSPATAGDNLYVSTTTASAGDFEAIGTTEEAHKALVGTATGINTGSNIGVEALVGGSSTDIGVKSTATGTGVNFVAAIHASASGAVNSYSFYGNSGRFFNADSLSIIGGVIQCRKYRSLVDDGTWTFFGSTWGFGTISADGGVTYASFRFTNDGVVTLLTDCTADVASTDTDTKLCIYDGGSGIIIKNRLGDLKYFIISITYAEWL